MGDYLADYLIVQEMGLVDYEGALLRMNEFTTRRTGDTIDQFWSLQHPRVYTLGHAADPTHLLDTGTIPVVQSDRGGDVTYHGPGQVVLYLLVDLNRKGLGPRTLVDAIEESVIELLAGYSITGTRRAGAPGVYLGEEKIAALGLRIRHGCSFHGVSLNVDMDLAPFSGIDPCGYAGLKVTQLADHGVSDPVDRVASLLTELLSERLRYRHVDRRNMEELRRGTWLDEGE